MQQRHPSLPSNDASLDGAHRGAAAAHLTGSPDHTAARLWRPDLQQAYTSAAPWSASRSWARDVTPSFGNMLCRCDPTVRCDR